MTAGDHTWNGSLFRALKWLHWRSLPAVSFAAHGESAIRNCTWCHGGSAQGYSPAPRLAGQRAIYIEQQLASFATHARRSLFEAIHVGRSSQSQPAGGTCLVGLFLQSAAPRGRRWKPRTRGAGRGHLSTRHARGKYCRLCSLPRPKRRRRRHDSSNRRARLHLS